jgi:hypothetical protein
MFDIHEVSAAPHFPEALKAKVLPTRPENLFVLLSQAFENDNGVEIKFRDGEIFIALKAG